MNIVTETLVVPAGTSLVPGNLYLRLYHGRKDPDEELDDWGFQGPVFGPLSAVVMTYLTTIRLYGHNVSDEVWIDTTRDLVLWAGNYYGDFEIFVAGLDAKA